MRLLVFWVGLWPERWALRAGEGLGRLAFALGLRRRVALENLALVFPEKAVDDRIALARAHYAHLGRSAFEFFLAARWTDDELFARVTPTGWTVFEEAMAQGKGVIAATGHLGNFELFAAYVARRGVPLTAVTRALRGRFNRAWMALRGHLGVRELRGKNVVAAMLSVLREKEVLAVIVDQNLSPRRAVFVPFFGKLAATTPAPAILAERTGAPILLAGLFRLPDGRFEMALEGPFVHEHTGKGKAADVADLTRRINEGLEQMIRAHPEQWFWVHRRWKTRPEEEAGTKEVLPGLL